MVREEVDNYFDGRVDNLKRDKLRGSPDAGGVFRSNIIIIIESSFFINRWYNDK